MKLNIKCFNLEDLVGRTLKIKEYREEYTKIIVAQDVSTGDFFVLKEIQCPMPGET